MAKSHHALPFDPSVEEDYIDMDVSSTTSFFCYSISPPPPPPPPPPHHHHHSMDFEFHMSSTPVERQPTTSPADELFYKGKLLPLHLPPRLQMMEKLLQNLTFDDDDDDDEGLVIVAKKNNPYVPSPITSRNASGELNQEGFLSARSHSNKSWCKKLRSIKKASSAYLKSLFAKSPCSDESKPTKKLSSFALIRRERRKLSNNGDSCCKMEEEEEEEEELGASTHRRSFSSAIKWHSSNKSCLSSVSSSSSLSSSSSNSSSFSSSSNSNSMLKRSSSVNSEVEISVQGAIAYCKKSQQLVDARKSVSDVGLSSITASKFAADAQKQERLKISRGGMK